MASECSSNRRRASLVSLDRLSSLHVELIHIIFQHMPLRDVVRTSALSRAWRYIWMSVPKLIFDERSISPPVEGQRRTNPVDCINQVLLLHNATLSLFKISNYLDCWCPDVDRWILVLERKQVKKLFLNFPMGGLYKVPTSLFDCQNLRMLRLRRCILNLPPHTKGFSNLVSLDLTEVALTNETIASLISNSPLELLTLDSCNGFSCLNIYAPKLKMFNIRGPWGSINFENTPNLGIAYIGYIPFAAQVFVPMRDRSRRFKDVLGDIFNVEMLFIHKYFVEILAGCFVPEKLSCSFNHLVYISLQVNLEDSKEISTTLCLFKSSPCLETIVIKNCSSEHLIDLTEEGTSEARLHLEKVPFPALHSVELYRFKGVQRDMNFVQFILMNAVVLQTMSIDWMVNVQDGIGKTRALEKMMEFQRASPRAKVKFLSQ